MATPIPATPPPSIRFRSHRDDEVDDEALVVGRRGGVVAVAGDELEAGAGDGEEAGAQGGRDEPIRRAGDDEGRHADGLQTRAGIGGGHKTVDEGDEASRLPRSPVVGSSPLARR